MTDPVLDHLTWTAWLYYERDLTQDEIARRLGTSRQSVSRNLARARSLGIVEISITRALPELLELQEDVAQTLGLSRVIIGNSQPGESPRATAARAAGRLLHELPGQVASIGVGWGTTLFDAVKTLPARRRDIRVIEIVGRPAVTDQRMAAASALAQKWSAELIPIPSPALVRTEELATQLRQDTAVTVAIGEARAASMIFASVGDIGPGATLVSEGLLTEDQRSHLLELGAVGDVLGHFFDVHGDPVGFDSFHMVGLSIEDLREHPDVTLVAAGDDKVGAVHGCIENGVAKGLVTDESTAQKLLQSAPP